MQSRHHETNTQRSCMLIDHTYNQMCSTKGDEGATNTLAFSAFSKYYLTPAPNQIG
jgi:hypothetical protein